MNQSQPASIFATFPRHARWKPFPSSVLGFAQEATASWLQSFLEGAPCATQRAAGSGGGLTAGEVKHSCRVNRSWTKHKFSTYKSAIEAMKPIKTVTSSSQFHIAWRLSCLGFPRVFPPPSTNSYRFKSQLDVLVPCSLPYGAWRRITSLSGRDGAWNCRVVNAMTSRYFGSFQRLKRYQPGKPGVLFFRQLRHCVPFPLPLFGNEKYPILSICFLRFFTPLYAFLRHSYAYLCHFWNRWLGQVDHFGRSCVIFCVIPQSGMEHCNFPKVA